MQGTFLALSAEGRMEVVQGDLNLALIYEYTNGGPIQLVEVPAIDGLSPMGIGLFCNEEGKLRTLPVNDVATDIMCDLFEFHDFIVGDVLFFRSRDKRGRVLEDGDSLTREQLDWLQNMVNERVH
jgi:Domain of unknown function (DUF3846)